MDIMQDLIMVLIVLNPQILLVKGGLSMANGRHNALVVRTW